MNELLDTLDWIWVAIGLVVVWAGRLYRAPVRTWRWVRRVVRQVGGMLDTLGGRDAQADPVTGEVLPAVLPLGHRIGALEAGQAAQTEALREVVNLIAASKRQDERLDGHDRDIAALMVVTGLPHDDTVPTPPDPA